LPVGILVVRAREPDLPLVYVNSAFERITGYTSDEVLGRNCRFLQGDDRGQPALDELRAAIKDSRPCQVLLRNYRKDGSLFWNELSIVPLYDTDGQLSHFVGIQNDVTKRKRNEAELNALYNATALLYQADSLLGLGQQIVQAVVQEFKQADCGLMLVDWEQRRLYRLARTGDYVVDTDKPLWLDGPGLVAEALRSGKTIYAPNVENHPLYLANVSETRSELVIPLRGKKELIGALDLQSNMLDAFSIRDRELLATFADHAAAALSLMQLYEQADRYAADMEWRVAKHTAELERAKNRVEIILMNSSDAIIMASTDGVVGQTNQAFRAMFGYEADAGFRLPLTRLIDSTSQAAFNEAFQQAVNALISTRVEIVGRRQDGRSFHADVALAPVFDDEKSSANVVCSVRDISARKQAELELRNMLAKERELSELKTRFVSIVSHEFRTPLATIMSSADLLKSYSDRMKPERRLEHLDKIMTHVKRLTNLLDDVLTLSKSQSTEMRFNAERIRLEGFCLDIIAEMQSIAPHKLLHFMNDSPCAEADLDPKFMRQAVTNLVSNAIKYSPEGSSIEFRLACQDGYAMIEVQDQGIGIPEEDQKHLFEVFHRANNVGTIPGTGLGLMILKQAVDLHQGSISFKSQVGEGTTFTVRIPLRQSGA
jgi:PAS domain S-box-containing protein